MQEKDLIGFITTRREETQFLKLEKSDNMESYPDLVELTDSISGGVINAEFKRLEINIKLSSMRYEMERHRYSFVDLLADFGGFNDGLLLIASLFVQPYSRKVFKMNFA